MNIEWQILNWLDDSSNGVQSRSSLQDLEQWRATIADKFSLLPTNPSIDKAFKTFTARPYNFLKVEMSSIIASSEVKDRSWIKPKEEREYWANLCSYLQKKGRGSSIDELDKHTEQILEHLAPSNSTQNTEVKGLVVGYVQSGKTANMTALVAKAVDSGYRMVIVFGGVLNSLRQQTQVRFDQELTGGDSEVWQANWKLLGRVDRPPRGKDWYRLTTAFPDSPKKGDFQQSQANPSIADGHRPILIVVKKNPKRLKALREYLQSSCRGSFKFPVLILDDESDQATINTKYSQGDVVATNKEIRELLKIFNIRSYVGYTATPYANILVDPTDNDEDLGRDLFPKNFIYPIDPPPQGYVGARELFGINMDLPELDRPGLPIFEVIGLNELALLAGKNPIDTIDMHTPKLMDALNSYILSCSLREGRGHASEDMSMLIHPSSYVSIQNKIATPVKKYLEYLKKMSIENPSKLLELLRPTFENSFQNVTNACNEQLKKTFILPSSLDSILKEIIECIYKLQVVILHSGSDDVLYYGDRENPKRYIIIGGNKLSRGLTLEGLSISYYCRNSKAYDTLMQMGRWFGYRGDYVDLTRLYLSHEAKTNFTDTAFVELDLRAQFASFRALKLSPIEACAKIIRMPSMRVTAKNRMGAGREVEIDYSSQRIERFKYDFNSSQSINEFNNKIINFLKTLKTPILDVETKKEGMLYFDKLLTSKELINDLLEKSEFGNIDKQTLIPYLSEKAIDVEWGISIAGKVDGNKTETFKFGDWEGQLSLINRSIKEGHQQRFGPILAPKDLEKVRVHFENKGKGRKKTGSVLIYFIDTSVESLKKEIENLPPYIVSIVIAFPTGEFGSLGLSRFGIEGMTEKEMNIILDEEPLVVPDED